MNHPILRAVACAGICASLTGCVGRGGAGLFAYLLAETVATIAAAASKDSKSEPTTTAPVTPMRVAVYPDSEGPDMLTCEAKRREFMTVFAGARRLPPQLRCSADGEFGAPQVYGSGRAADAVGRAGELADGTL